MSEHLDEWHPLSERYGQQRTVSGEPWKFRHFAATHPYPGDRRCVCPGTCTPAPAIHQCGLAMTQEDFLCDECRQWCVAVDSDGNYHQLASLR